MAQQSNVSAYPKTIYDFAYFPYKGPPFNVPPAEAISRAWPDTVARLADLAEKEDWTGQSSNAIAPHGILHNYILYTYQRLVIEDKISIRTDRTHATFNTGLLTRNNEEIFALFIRNNKKDTPPFVLMDWVTESNRTLMQKFSRLPEMAKYVAVAADLVYDTDLPLTLSTEHIIHDNLGRFPTTHQNEFVAGATLNYAKDRTLKRLRRNFKIAIPQWYPMLGAAGAQLLLPLDLTGDGVTDLALVVSKIEEGYRGHTVLTLEMAYSNARLVARPDSDWLKPEVDNSDWTRPLSPPSIS